jgi:hypothetical protein
MPTQLAVSASTFIDNSAFIGGVQFTEADTLNPVDCVPLPCNGSGNVAQNYGMDRATPARTINIAAPLAVRSGAPLPITVTLTDGYGQLLNEWDDLVVTITTDALLSGLTRVFYASGAAVFSSLTLKGIEGTSYALEVTVVGPDVFGNDEVQRSTTLTISVQPCEVGETFNEDGMDCACAGASVRMMCARALAWRVDLSSMRCCVRARRCHSWLRPRRGRPHVPRMRGDRCAHAASAHASQTRNHGRAVAHARPCSHAQRLFLRTGCRAWLAPR